MWRVRADNSHNKFWDRVLLWLFCLQRTVCNQVPGCKYNFLGNIVFLRDCGYWQGPGKPGILQDWKVLEKSSWSWKVLDFCYTQVIKWNVWETVRCIKIEILGVKGLMWILKSWENQSECWKIRNLFLKESTYPSLGSRLRVLITDVSLCNLTPGHSWRSHVDVVTWFLLDLIATLIRGR